MQILPKQAIEDYTELYELVRGKSYLEVLSIVGANKIRSTSDWIDINYKSLAVTIKRTADYMAIISTNSIEYYEE